MSKAMTIDVNVDLNVPYETAEICMKIVNQYLKNKPGHSLTEYTEETGGYDYIYSYKL